MGVREKLNEKPAIAVGIMAGAVLVAVVLLYWQRSGGPPGPPTRAFYTDDDGATYFEGALSIDRDIPFDRNARMVYRAWVFQCGDEQPFIAFIGRHSADRSGPYGLDVRPMEIKRVGADDRSWIRMDGVVEERLFSTVPCPSGGVARQVLP